MTTPVGSNLGIDFDDETALNAGWITREDAALKKKLQGIRVPVANEQRLPDSVTPVPDVDTDDGELVTVNGKLRTVPVFFRLPEDEVRRKTYPYITIDFITAVRDSEREHRGQATWGVEDTYRPMGMPAGGGTGEMPIPYVLQYQITQWARYAHHDRAIMTQLMFDRLEPRFGFLEMVATAEAPDDNSIRRLDLLSGPVSGDTRDAEGKRLFRKIYTVGVQSELFHSELTALAAVGRVILDVTELE